MIKTIIENMIEDVQEGELNPLEAYARLKEAEQLIKKALLDTFDLALDETDKHGAKSFTAHGFKFEKRNGKRTYHFDHIPDYVEANKFMKEVKQKYTDAYNQSQKGNTLIDDNGEVLPMAKVTHSKDTIIVRPLDK